MLMEGLQHPPRGLGDNAKVTSWCGSGTNRGCRGRIVTAKRTATA